MADALWTADEIAGATGGRTSAPFSVNGLSIDTRSLEPGDLFVALKDVRDGHDFVPTAFANGATGALVNRRIDAGPTIEVDDVLSALERLGLAARDRAPNCYRVAVTGSVGKTSVKEMLARMFRALGPAHWNVRSFNNHWGVPLTLARMPRETERAVFEIGMNTPGEIAPRSVMVKPHTALITKIAPAHLEGLGSVAGVAEEKAGIFAGLLPGGTAILPYEDAFTPVLKRRALDAQPNARIKTFGTHRDADARIIDSTGTGDRTHVKLKLHGETLTIDLHAIGDHWALNAAAALLAACPDPSPHLKEFAAALNGYAPPPGRGTSENLRLANGGTYTLIDDAYNANPESMRAALSAFAARPNSGQRIVALGEMLEIGTTSEGEHASLDIAVLAAKPDLVLLAGAAMQALKRRLDGRVNLRWEPDAKALEPGLKKVLKNGDLVLLKGSNASGMARLAEQLRQWTLQAEQQADSVGKADTEKAAGGIDVI